MIGVRPTSPSPPMQHWWPWRPDFSRGATCPRARASVVGP